MFEALGGDVLGVPTEGSAVVRAGGAWRASETPGYWIKPLVEDAAAGIRTWLVRSEPGATSALHSHEDIEQIYVIEGSFTDGETTYGPGDFVIRAAGAPHLTVGGDGALSLVMYNTDARRRR